MSNFIVQTKIGIFTGTIMGAIVLLWFLISPSRGPLLPNYGIGDISFFIFTMCLPTLLSGAISASIVEGVLIKKYVVNIELLSRYKTGTIAGCILGGVLSFPIGVFLGIVIGGFFGGGIGGTLGDKIGLVKIAISVGIAFGMSVVAIIATVLGASFGGALGYALHTVAGKVASRFF